ncbi:MAG: hypothetical protein LUE98_13115 [Tannerellaceae bacterium]|nr:hypothetical protein [Tannerellaceae bacterium]
MKHFLLLFISLCLFAGSAQAQKIHRQYAFYPQEEGNVYFIYPQKGFTSADKDVVKGLVYDITYVSGRDSASFIFSYFTKNVVQAKSIVFKDTTGNILYEAPVTMMFTQPKKNNWHQRAQVMIPYETLTSLYEQPQPYAICLNGGKEILFEISPKSWKKQSGVINKIFEVVKYNR